MSPLQNWHKNYLNIGTTSTSLYKFLSAHLTRLPIRRNMQELFRLREVNTKYMAGLLQILPYLVAFFLTVSIVCLMKNFCISNLHVN